jgi:hypothetical protein
MRSFFTLTSLFLAATALPFPQPSTQDDVGAKVVESINYVSTQYSLVVTEIERFAGNRAMAKQLFGHAEETLQSLNSALQVLNQIKTFDISTTLQLVAPLTSLDFKVHQMATALKDKKDAIIKGNYGPRVHAVLHRTYDGADALMKSLVEKLPVGISAMVNVLSKEIIYTLGNARDMFQGAAGMPAMAPVVQPQNNGYAPNNGGYAPQYAPQNNGYRPQNNGYRPQNGGRVPQYVPAPQNNGYAPKNGGYVPAAAPEQQQEQQEQQDTDTSQAPEAPPASSVPTTQQAW